MFVQRVFGKQYSVWIAFFQTMKLLASNCCMALALSSYLQEMTTRSAGVRVACWCCCFSGFTVLVSKCVSELVSELKYLLPYELTD